MTEHYSDRASGHAVAEIRTARFMHHLMDGIPLSIQRVPGSPETAAHAPFIRDSYVVNDRKGEIPAIHCGKTVGVDIICLELLTCVLPFFGALIEINGIDEVDIAHAVITALVRGGLEVVLHSGAKRQQKDGPK